MTMKVSFQKPSSQKVLCLGVYEENIFPSVTQDWDSKLKGFLKESVEESRFKGKLTQSLPLNTPEGNLILLIGMGKEQDQNETQWQKVGASLLLAVEMFGKKEAAVEIHGIKGKDDAIVAANLALGALLRSWRFEKYYTKKEADELFPVKEMTFLTSDPQNAEKSFKPLEAAAEGVFLTRTVVTEPPNVMTTEELAKAAESLKEYGVSVEVLDKNEIKKLGMGALLGVAQGSVQEPKVLVMHYNGASTNEAPIAFVGKGVIFDSGGISIKPSQGMEAMKMDMAGAGVILGLMKTLALRKAKVNVVGVAGVVENMPSGSAQRPSDIVKSMSGQTIEVLNTDAEGRLVLADALWYTQNRFKPKLMIDLATLTGAIIVCLGYERAGLFTPDEKLKTQLTKAGDEVGELVWAFPMDDVYDLELNSEIADVKNIGNGRGAGSITAAKFMQRFTNEVPWAHLDIAGVASVDKDTPLSAKGATGYGVRLLDRFLADNYEQ